MVSRFMARQFAKPSGVFGRVFLGGLLNRANIRSNKFVYNLVSPQPDDVILEIGFGGADLLCQVAQALDSGKIHGIELSNPMLERAKKRIQRLPFSDKITLQHGLVESLPFDSNQFDTVCSVNTIYFWPDLDQSFREVARVIRPGGKLILGFASDQSLRQSGYDVDGFILRSLEEVQSLLTNSGLEIEEIQQLKRKQKEPFYGIKSILR